LIFIGIRECVKAGLEICMACEERYTDEYAGCNFAHQREHIENMHDTDIIDHYFDELT